MAFGHASAGSTSFSANPASIFVDLSTRSDLASISTVSSTPLSRRNNSSSNNKLPTLSGQAQMRVKARSPKSVTFHLPSQSQSWLNTCKQLCLPRFMRSLRGLGLLVFTLSTAVVWILVSLRVDPVIANARLEAQMALLAEADPMTSARPAMSRPIAGIPLKSLWPFKSASSSFTPVRKRSEESSGHAYDPNGLLVVNTNSTRHPILELIEKGDKDWQRLNMKQSKNLKQATSEYRKRYKRNPPTGFDKWWAYAQRNKVNLPDEYDQVHKDLAPFWAIDPNDLRHRASVMQKRGHTFTVVIHSGKVSLEGEFAHIKRATDIAALMRQFSSDLPRDVNMTFVMDDSPAIMLQSEAKTRMVEMAAQGEYFGLSDQFSEDDEWKLSNYARACPPTSRLREAERKGQPSRQRKPKLVSKSFVFDQSKANDLCDHPEIKGLHGHTIINGTNLTPLAPLFTWAKMPTHSDILVTPLEQYSDTYIGYDPPWDLKTENKLLWRGSTTGADFTTSSPWRESQRSRLHFQSREQNGTRDLMWADEDGSVVVGSYSNDDLNEKYMDTSFSGSPAQCDPETCDIMSKEIDFAGLQGLDDSYQYKYMMDVDGNAWSGRFHRLMSTKSLVFKSTVFPEWYADRIIPWYHYVPVKVDYTDLYDILAFFIGTPDGKGAHDELANRLAQNGKDWAKRNWRRSDMASYMYRLTLEYIRLLHQEQDMDFIA